MRGVRVGAVAGCAANSGAAIPMATVIGACSVLAVLVYWAMVHGSHAQPRVIF